MRVGAGQARDDRRVRAERDHVAGRERAAVLRHRRILVDARAAIEEVVANDGAVLDTECKRHAAARVRQLFREREELGGIRVRRVVAYAHPSVVGAADVAWAGAAESWQHLLDVMRDGIDVVGLHVDESKRRAACIHVRELVDRGGEDALDGRESKPLVDGTRYGVALEHVKLEHLGTTAVRLRRSRLDKLAREPLAARIRSYIEEVEDAAPRSIELDDHDAVVVGEQDAAVHERALDVRELLGTVVVTPRQVRLLDAEGVPELAYERQVLGGGGADHGTRCASSR